MIRVKIKEIGDQKVLDFEGVLEAGEEKEQGELAAVGAASEGTGEEGEGDGS